MVAFSGKQGKVSFNAEIASNVVAWSIDATCDVADTTIMSALAYTAATHWKDYEIGFKDWTGSFDCLLDDEEFDADGIDLANEFGLDTDGLALILYAGMVAADQQEGATVRKYSGNAMITDIGVSTDKDDVAKVTFSFQGSGTLSVAASDAT